MTLKIYLALLVALLAAALLTTSVRSDETEAGTEEPSDPGNPPKDRKIPFGLYGWKFNQQQNPLLRNQDDDFGSHSGGRRHKQHHKSSGEVVDSRESAASRQRLSEISSGVEQLRADVQLIKRNITGDHLPDETTTAAPSFFQKILHPFG